MFYKWRAKFGDKDASMMKRLKELESENTRLKKMYTEERLKEEIAGNLIVVMALISGERSPGLNVMIIAQQ